MTFALGVSLGSSLIKSTSISGHTIWVCGWALDAQMMLVLIQYEKPCTYKNLDRNMGIETLL